MKEQELNDLIDRMRRAPLPDCPGSLDQNVLRRIRLSRHETSPSLLDWLMGLLPQPGVVLTAVALAVTISSGFTIVVNQNQEANLHSHDLASNALGFEVFQSNEILKFENR